MIKRITDINEYIRKCDVENFKIEEKDYNQIINIFGNEIRVNSNPWLWHVHLKATDICNAKCNFCVEQGCEINENADNFLESVDLMLSEMERENKLFSVSLTGGEPLVFSKLDELLDILKSHPIKFLTMNTNAKFLPDNIDKIDGLFDFVNISRHSINDDTNNEIFKGKMLTRNELIDLKKALKSTKMRFQCVMQDVVSTQDMEDFISAFNFADDISFRRLMKLPDEYGITYENFIDNYDEILDYAKDHFEFLEQTILDYYVYEIWRANGTDVVFSYSNMDLLRKEESVEKEDIFREFIIHPDGMVSGSWKKDNKILYKAK